MAGRILVIRGGAIGDFILTLPAIALLRESFPGAHLEILGYRHIVALAEGRHYAQAGRSIEYGPMAGFFVPGSKLAPDLVEYFGGFQQIISYLFDPDGHFEASLRRAGARNILPAFVRVDDSAHAAQQLAAPLQKMALYLESPAARVYPSVADHQVADAFLAGLEPRPWVAIHPGSGSARKNWPLEHWIALGRSLLESASAPGLLLVGGEADEARLEALRAAFAGAPVAVVRNWPLPHLAALLSRCRIFLGHDSGIGHLAAAVGTRCMLLFGPTDPRIWAPANEGVSVLSAPGGVLEALRPGKVLEHISDWL